MSPISLPDKATIFSSPTFCHIWADTHSMCYQAEKKQDSLGLLYSKSRRLPLKNYFLSAAGLYWGNTTHDSHLDAKFVQLVRQTIKAWNSASLIWSFRYDAQHQLALATDKLNRSSYQITEGSTHVLVLNGDSYERVITQRAKSVTRQQIRYGTNSGLQIKEIVEPEDFRKHYALYEAWATNKGVATHPKALFQRLGSELSKNVSLLGAFQGNTLCAAILVFHDQYEWFYWHSIRDFDQTKAFAVDILLAHVLEQACTQGALYFNMGSSSNIKSLEFFKERWGATKQPVWMLTWQNPLWKPMFNLKKKLRTVR